MSIVLVGSSSGSITLQEPAVAGTTVLDLPATSGTVVVSGTTPTLNGVTFPATQVPSADANTLDDYEEGTWTPVKSSGSATIRDVSGNYTKIGNRVICSFVFVGNTSGTISTIGGLPFTASDATNGSARETENTGFIWCAQVLNTSTTFNFRRYDNNDALTANNVYVGMIAYKV
jgi:hypothetical protein